MEQENLNSEELEFFNNLNVNDNPDVHKVKYSDKEIYIVGTAHISKKSQILVKKVISELKPDKLCIELDPQRYETIMKQNKWEDLNIFEIIKKKQTFLLIAQLLLAGFQKKMGNQLGVKPGSEMIEAINDAKLNNIPIDLVDRNVSITLKRAWNKTPFFKKIILVSNMISGFFSKHEIDEEKLSAMRKSDVITEMMDDLNKYLPEAKTVLIDERDQFIIKKTVLNPEKKIALVVGAGHVNGIKKMLLEQKTDDIDLDYLNEIPRISPIKKLIPWSIPALILGLLFYGIATGDYDKVKNGTTVWILANGIFSALGTVIVLAHPLSVLTAFIAAPITSLNPTIGCGLVVGLSESFFRKPRVIDFKNLSTDIESFKGWFRNRLTRIILAFIGSSIGSAIGTWVGLSMILSNS